MNSNAISSLHAYSVPDPSQRGGGRPGAFLQPGLQLNYQQYLRGERGEWTRPVLGGSVPYPLLSFVFPKPSAAPHALCPHCPLSPCPSSRHAACLKLGVATCLQHSRTSLAEVPCWSHLFAAESSPGSAVPPNDQS